MALAGPCIALLGSPPCVRHIYLQLIGSHPAMVSSGGPGRLLNFRHHLDCSVCKHYVPDGAANILRTGNRSIFLTISCALAVPWLCPGWQLTLQVVTESWPNGNRLARGPQSSPLMRRAPGALGAGGELGQEAGSPGLEPCPVWNMDNAGTEGCGQVSPASGHRLRGPQGRDSRCLAHPWASPPLLGPSSRGGGHACRHRETSSRASHAGSRTLLPTASPGRFL